MELKYEKCEVYADSTDRFTPPFLKFKRKLLEGEGVTVCILSAAMDYEDFAWFEYEDVGRSIFPRRMSNGEITRYPKYVHFCKKL